MKLHLLPFKTKISLSFPGQGPKLCHGNYNYIFIIFVHILQVQAWQYIFMIMLVRNYSYSD